MVPTVDSVRDASGVFAENGDAVIPQTPRSEDANGVKSLQDVLTSPVEDAANPPSPTPGLPGSPVRGSHIRHSSIGSTSQSPIKSPHRPKGPGQPTTAHTTTQAEGRWLPSLPEGPSSLFGLFKRQPSVENLSMYAPSRASVNGSLYGGLGLDDLGAPADLASPKAVKQTGAKTLAALQAAQAYRDALEATSNAAARFGSALDDLSQEKGTDKASAGLQAAAGLHLLVSNHLNILESSIRDKFVAPVGRSIEGFRDGLASRETRFRNELRAKNRALRESEQAMQRLARRRQRNFSEYRSALLDITNQIDDINRLKYEFLSDMYTESSDMSGQVLRHLSSVVTAEIEIFESIARKGWSGGGLDGLLAGCPDPFSNDNDNDDEQQNDNEQDHELDQDHNDYHSQRKDPGVEDSPGNLFSVLPHRSILTPLKGPTSPTADGDLTLSTHRSDSEDD